MKEKTMSEHKFKVGDEVWVKGKVVEVCAEDKRCPIMVQDALWPELPDILPHPPKPLKWVKTSDRLPTKEDADEDYQVFVADKGGSAPRLIYWHIAMQRDYWASPNDLNLPEPEEELVEFENGLKLTKEQVRDIIREVKVKEVGL